MFERTFLDEIREGTVVYPPAPDQGLIKKHFLGPDVCPKMNGDFVVCTDDAEKVLDAVWNELEYKR